MLPARLSNFFRRSKHSLTANRVGLVCSLKLFKTKPPTVWLAVAGDAHLQLITPTVWSGRPGLAPFRLEFKLPFGLPVRSSAFAASPETLYLDLFSVRCMNSPSISGCCCKDYRSALKTRVDNVFIRLHSNSSLIYLSLPISNESFILAVSSSLSSLWAGAKQSGV